MLSKQKGTQREGQAIFDSDGKQQQIFGPSENYKHLQQKRRREEIGTPDGLKLYQRAYNWIAHELKVGTSLGRRHNLVRFQIWDQFWIPLPKLHGTTYWIFFVKPKTVSFDQFSRFLLFDSFLI